MRFITAIVISVLCSSAVAERGEAIPKYKPSSRSPQALDIRSNAYGASASAPDALSIGALAPAFSVPRAGGGTLQFPAEAAGDHTVLVFYRGHW